MNFSDLLKIYGYDPKDILLARHAGADGKIYLLWRENKEKFDLFCRIQKKGKFSNRKYVAHFVATPAGETLFTGFYKIIEEEKITSSLIDPISNVDLYTLQEKIPNIYKVKRMKEFDKYAGKLFIKWGKAYLAYVQKAELSQKEIIEIKKEIAEPEFPGFAKFTCSSKSISALPETWKSILSANKGVYILVHKETQKQYIGSATGDGGFLGRWLSYEANGHGGNIQLKKLYNPEFDIGILEVCSSSDTATDIIKREQNWKHKLGSRAFGLNSN